MRENRRRIALMPLLALAACASGPDYRTPAVTLPAGYAQAPAVAQAADAASLAIFWRQFDDPVLDGLVQAALQANLDVRIAQARLVEAQATLLGSEAASMPSVGLNGGVTRSVTPTYQLPGATRSQRTNTVYAPSAVMNWELDLFGRQQRATESAAARVTAQELGIGAAQSAVVAALAGNYLALRGLQQRLQVAEDALVNQREALRLTQARAGAGRGTEFDVARARTLVASTAAGVPALLGDIARAQHRIATLTGQPAAQVQATLAAPRALPRLAATDLSRLPVGTPEALLRRRPDIQVAERQLAAASAEIGVAMADRFPRLSLSGLLGFNTNRASDLGEGSSAVYSVGAALSWTALDFGRVRAGVRGAESRAERSRLVYEQTVLVALEEAENALSGYTRSAQRAAELAVAAGEAQRAARIARARLQAGSVDLLTVLDAERQSLSAVDQLAQADSGTAGALVEVYRALGGGWPGPASRAP
jgi:multidrug efflux system outer membrane protein